MFINKILYFFSSTAAKKNINNVPSDEILEHIKELDSFIQTANESWKKFSALNGIPESKFMIVSGYRCPILNKTVGGVPNSPHEHGYAADVYIKLSDYWFQYCTWMSEFAKDCYKNGIKFDQIAPEGNGKYNWMHISLYDGDRKQLMRSIEKPVSGSPFVFVQYGEEKPYEVQNFSASAESLQHIEEGKDPTNTEILGERGKVKIDTNIMPGSYARTIYIMKRLINSLGLKDFQAAGIVGNLLDDTNGRLSTTLSQNGFAGLSRWTIEDQIKYRKLFLNDSKLTEGNLLSQVSFLIYDLGKCKIVPKIRKTRNMNETCMSFYNNYERYGEKIDSLDTAIRKECSRRRGYSLSALDIYTKYKNIYQDDWLVGYFSGSGVNDGKPVEIGYDTKVWNSHDIQVSQEEIIQYANMITNSALEIDAKNE